MSFDARNNSAVLKRAEQLKRWEDSDTNRASNVPKDPATRKVTFSSGCVFLAACLSGDKEDILRLIESGVDIDTANVDGLTALHQVIFIYIYSIFVCSFIYYLITIIIIIHHNNRQKCSSFVLNHFPQLLFSFFFFR